MKTLVVLLLLSFAFWAFYRASTFSRRANQPTPSSANKNPNVAKWEQSLKTVWRGSDLVEFTYDSSSGRVRRKVTVNEVLVHPDRGIYLRGFCHVRQEERTFSENNIETKILRKSSRYDVDDYLHNVLGISEKALGWDG